MNSCAYKLLVFCIVSAGLGYISRRSLRVPRSHGLYRFLAWELLTALLLLNVDVWFATPWAPYQLVSWVLLLLCVVPLALGVRTLRTQGKPTAQRETEPHLLAFEKTSALVTTGIYHYIRHPLYCSLLLLGWGIFFKAPSGPGGLLALAVTVSLIATARVEEAECIRFFGSSYREYMKRTRMFVPFVL